MDRNDDIDANLRAAALLASMGREAVSVPTADGTAVSVTLWFDSERGSGLIRMAEHWPGDPSPWDDPDGAGEIWSLDLANAEMLADAITLGVAQLRRQLAAREGLAQ